jgi:hypothetical protein
MVIDSSQTLRIGEWSFVTAVLRGDTGYIYINGQQTAVSKMNRPRNVIRVNNYIGRSDMYPLEKDAHCVMSDLKIFNRALDPSEIILLMNSDKNII